MKGRIPNHFIQDLIARTDIIEIIQPRVHLKKRGQNYLACCPFHDEKSPSFNVNQPKQFYYCFGCQAHGNVIRFLMDYDRMDFLDAVDYLATLHGIDVPRETSGGSAYPEQPKLDPLYDRLEMISRFYQTHLRQSTAAIDYLKSRGLTGVTAKQFGIGYAPDAWDAVLSEFGQNETDKTTLLTLGMLIQKDNGQTYDRFRHRIVFPIRNAQGKLIGFGGRALSDDNKPKYLNSPETPLFHKSRELYGLYEAKQANRQLHQVVIVEGYMDVISLHQHGIQNAVATLGTACNPKHLQQLFRYTNDIVFCFDGDRAGRAAAWKALTMSLPLLRDGLHIRFLFLPEGEDPDSLVKRIGAASVRTLILQAEPISDVFFEQLKQDIPLTSVANKAEFAQKAGAYLQTMPQGVFHQLLQQRLAEQLSMRVEDLANLKPVQPPRPAPKVTKPQISLKAEGLLTPAQLSIAILLQSPHLAKAITLDSSSLDQEQPDQRLLISLHQILQTTETVQIGQLMAQFDSEMEQHLLAQLAARPLSIPQNGYQDELFGAIERLKQAKQKHRAQMLIEKAKSTELCAEEKAELRKILAEKVE